MNIRIRPLVLGLFCAILGIVLMLSLWSYDPTDHSLLFYSNTVHKTSNYLGVLGAQISAILLYLFGCSVLLGILLCFWVSSTLCRQWYSKKPREKSIAALRFYALLCAIPVLSTICYSMHVEFFAEIYPGGLIGRMAYSGLLNIFNKWQAGIFLGVVSWALTVVIAQFSWFAYVRPCAAIARSLLRPLAYVASSASDVIELFVYKYYSMLMHYLNGKEGKEYSDKEDITRIFSDPFWQEYTGATELKKSEKALEIINAENRKDNVTEHSPDSAMQPYSVPTCQHKQLEQTPDEAQFKKEGILQAQVLVEKLAHFGITGKVTTIIQGPVVTLFEYQPEVTTKISAIIAREDDLALALQALSLRIIAPIPGKSVIGFEVAHARRKIVWFNVLASKSEFKNSKSLLPLVLGKDTLGSDIIVDLAAMPHLLMAGGTGSGKSAGLNTMLMSLLCTKTPDELKLILIDPKRLEFSPYADIAHLLFPIVTESTHALQVLKWAVAAMQERYDIMAQAGVRNIGEYQKLSTKDTTLKTMPFIVIIIDELADLMMTSGKDVEHALTRLAQMARAAGIHLIVATQRPSVDVITGLIKVNFPSRIAFKVTSKVDSRTIIDTMGAEKLLGKGDMLFLDSAGVLRRVHGAYATDEEIRAVIAFIKEQRSVEYQPLVHQTAQVAQEAHDDLYAQVEDFVRARHDVSISLVQRVFRIGYNRSARLIEQLEQNGKIMQSDGSKMRKVIKTDTTI